MKKLLKILVTTAFFATILLAGTLSSCDGEPGTSSEPVPFATPEPTPTPDYLVASERKYDERGVTFSEYTYDERGNMLSSYSTEYDWREYQHLITDELLAMTDFSDLGRSVSNLDYTYDDQNRVIETKRYHFFSHYDYEGIYHEDDPSESVSYREYDGNIVRYRSEGSYSDSIEYEYEYDDFGRQIAYRQFLVTTGECLAETTWVYTQTGNTYTMEQYIDVLNENPFEQDGLWYMEQRTYDEQGREIEEIRDYIGNGLGSDYYRIEKDYDDAGNLIEERYHNRADVHWHTKFYTYDEAGRLLTFRQDYITHYSTGLSTGLRTDIYTSQIAPPEDFYGYGYNNVYDERGNLIEKTYTTPNDAGVYYSIFYTYDEHGNCIREETRTVGGNLTELIEREYVKRGEVEPEYIMTRYRLTRGGVLREELTYDETGKLLESRTLSTTTTYTYDDAGRLSYVDRPDGKYSAYTYDEAGRLTFLDEGSEGYTEYTYHRDGTYTEAETRFEDGVMKSQYTYLCDADGKKLEFVRERYDGGLTYATEGFFEYDEKGREVVCKEYDMDTGELLYDYAWVYTETDDSYTTERFDFDELERHEAYYYDAEGREIRYEYASGISGDYPYSRHTESAYNDSGNLVEVKLYEDGKLTRTEVHTYDEAGRILSTRIHRGSSGVGQSSLAAEYFHSGYDYTYDEQGRLVEKFTHNWHEYTESERTTYT